MEIREFFKMEGCGNDFVVVGDDRRDLDWSALAKKVCNRNFSVGSDGLMVVRTPRNGVIPVSMFNPDGSAMGMCGNGIRCVTRFALMQGLAPLTSTQVAFDVDGRAITCFPLREGRDVRVNMGKPSLSPSDLPLLRESQFIDQPLTVGSHVLTATAVAMPNPHCVTFVEDLAAVPFKELGPAIEHHPWFPKRTNVEFVQLLSRDRVRVLVWERGAGPTLACGTGACAVVVAAVVTKRCEPRCTVELPGGELVIEYDQSSQTVFMTGPAREVFRGEFCL